MPADLIPLAQAAKELGVSERTIYLLLKSGQVKRYKRGLDRQSYMDRHELRCFVKPRVAR